MELPLRRETVHQRTEAQIVRGLQQIVHFVAQDVLDAFRRLVRQLGAVLVVVPPWNCMQAASLIWE